MRFIFKNIDSRTVSFNFPVCTTLQQKVKLMGTLNLDKIFNPQNVAIIGASDVEGSVGFAIVKNFTQMGYTGKVFFVNNRICPD